MAVFTSSEFAIAAAHDAERQLAADGRQAGDKRAVGVCVDDRAAGAVGEQHHAIVGRALAVDRDRVERIVDRFPQSAVE